MHSMTKNLISFVKPFANMGQVTRDWANIFLSGSRIALTRLMRKMWSKWLQITTLPIWWQRTCWQRWGWEFFWSSCVAHTIGLVLENIGNLPKHNTVIENARSISVFIYSHISTLALMRKFINRRESWFVRMTRFATSFLNLGVLLTRKCNWLAWFHHPIGMRINGQVQ